MKHDIYAAVAIQNEVKVVSTNRGGRGMTLALDNSSFTGPEDFATGSRCIFGRFILDSAHYLGCC